MDEKRAGEIPEEDALSFCDLPHSHQSKEENEKDNITPPIATETHEDFDFCFLSGEPEMCAADEVFYEGRILPLRQHSANSENVFPHIHDCSRSISSSEDHFSSGGPISCRSSSTSSSAVAAGDLKLPPRGNRFHSHLSPSPKTRLHTNKWRTMGSNARKKSSVWDILRLGLVSPPPEIAFLDLKSRYPSNNNGKNFAKRNSGGSRDRRRVRRRGFFGGCRCCSTDAVDAVRSRVVVTKSEVRGEEEENLLGQKSQEKQWSHYRTCEWLKYLSLEGKTEDEP